MGTGFRTYIIDDDDELKRVSNRVYEGLLDKNNGLPEYADQKIQLLRVILETEDGKPAHIVRAYGAWLNLDGSGYLADNLAKQAATQMDLHYRVQNETGNVVDLEARQKLDRLKSEHQWKPTKDHLDKASADTWPDGDQPRLKLVKSAKAKRPPLTTDARWALKDIQKSVFEISTRLDRLTEPALKGLAYKCREEAEDPREECGLWEGIAQACDHRIEVKRRYRRGNGVWYAVVNITRWRHESGIPIGEDAATFYEKCDGRKAAIAATKKLLKKHADKFNRNLSIEASVCTDLEWGN